MGDYAGTTDVYNRAPLLQTAITITGTVLDGLIDETEAEINRQLKRCGYTVPITNATDVLILKRQVAQRTAAIGWRGEFVDADEAPANIRRYETEWDAFDEELRGCEIVFENTDPSTASQNITVGVLKLNSDMRFEDD